MSGAARMRMTWTPGTVGLMAEVDGLSFEMEVRRDALGPPLIGHVSLFVDSFELRDKVAGLGHALAFLQGPGAGRAEVLAAIVPLMPEGTAELARRVPSAFTAESCLWYYLDDPRTGPGRRAMAYAAPSLASVLHLVGEEAGGRDWLDATPADARRLLEAYAPGARPGTISRILARTSPVPGTATLDALLAIPPDWHPSEDDGARGEAEAFEAVARSTSYLATMLGGRAFLTSSRGRWREFRDRSAAAASDPRGMLTTLTVLPCRDPARALAEQVLLPGLLARGVLDARSLSALGKPSGYGTNPEHVGARMLYGGKSLPAILETSARWHARQHAMGAAIEAAGTALAPDSARKATPARWPVPFSPMTAPNGVTLRFLSSKAELAAEGARGAGDDGVDGLSHCVGGYSGLCLDGSVSILSLSVPGEAGYRRLSTASLSLNGGKAKVGEHSGLGNSKPPAEAADALEWFLGEVALGRLVPAPEYVAPGWRRSRGETDIATRCGYDPNVPGAVEAALAVWAPLLPRPLRDLDALLAAAAPHLPDRPYRQSLAERIGESVESAPTWAKVAAAAVAVAGLGAALHAFGILGGTATLLLAFAVPVGLWDWGAMAFSPRAHLYCRPDRLTPAAIRARLKGVAFMAAGGVAAVAAHPVALDVTGSRVAAVAFTLLQALAIVADHAPLVRASRILARSRSRLHVTRFNRRRGRAARADADLPGPKGFRP